MGQDSDLLFVMSYPFTVLLLIKEMVMVQPKKNKNKKIKLMSYVTAYISSEKENSDIFDLIKKSIHDSFFW